MAACVYIALQARAFTSAGVGLYGYAALPLQYAAHHLAPPAGVWAPGAWLHAWTGLAMGRAASCCRWDRLYGAARCIVLNHSSPPRTETNLPLHRAPCRGRRAPARFPRLLPFCRCTRARLRVPAIWLASEQRCCGGGAGGRSGRRRGWAQPPAAVIPHSCACSGRRWAGSWR